MRLHSTLLVVFSTLVAVLVSLVASQNVEKFEFQAEVSRMMDIIINSLYQKKEVFLREVISNSADALDKIRFLSLKDPSLLGEGENRDLEMRVSFNEEEKTLTFRDRGIGMTKQELIENLGTVAKSGTTNFFEQLADKGDLNLIGQFGVGFYSVYLVADRVQVKSKSNDDEQYIWESTADSTFTVVKDPEGNSLGRGTEIKLFLKEDAMEYATQERLEELVKRYSQFIGFPIYLYKKDVQYVDDKDTEEESDDDEDDLDSEDSPEGEETEEKEEKSTPKEVISWKWTRLNDQLAIWTRSPSDVTDEEYRSFYKTFSKDYEDPLTWTHFKGEGEVEFKSIMYIPKRPPPGLLDNYYKTKSLMKLYVRKVLIKDDYDELLPNYLNFIKGVVDSDDLPLSVSRETLQQERAIKVISKKLVRKALDMIKRMADAELKAAKIDVETDDEESEEEPQNSEVAKYSDFYSEFGKNIKLGVVEDLNNRPKLSKLLRFKTSLTEATADKAAIGLEQYVKRMASWQKEIYYLTGDSIETLLTSPFLDQAKSKNVEVLLMDDPLDEYVLQNMQDFEGKKLQSLSKEGVKFGDETEQDKQREKQYKKEFKKLAKWLKDEVYNSVAAGPKSSSLERVVITTSRIDEKMPAVMLSAQHGHSATMERIMKSQALGDTKRAAAMSKRILELNPRHPIVAKLKDLYDQQDLEKASDIAWLLHDAALVNSGYDIENGKDFAQRMFKLMQSGLKLDSLAPLPWLEPEEDEVEEPLDPTPKEEL